MLKVGDLIFVYGNKRSIIDDLIKTGEILLTRDEKVLLAKEYVHVAVYVGLSNILEAQGFRKSGLASIGDYSGDYDIGRIDMTDAQRGKFLAALHTENGLPYDWVGIFWLVVKALTGYSAKYEEHKKRYCSTYVGWALKQAGINVDDETPESLALDPKVRIIKG